MNCDSDIKEEIQESMKLPWMKKPFYQTNAKNTTPNWRPKRRKSLSNSLRRAWYDLCDDWGDVILCFMMVAVFVGVVAVWATWPR